MYRFFVPPEWIRPEGVRLEGEVAHRLGRVLRMSPGEEVILLDNTGWEYRVRLRAFGRGWVEGELLSRQEGRGEPAVRVGLYQGLLKGEKFEWVLQKGTELGISAFYPLICRRSIPRVAEGWRNRLQRWQRIVAEAAEQSGRSRLPAVHLPLPFEVACRGISPDSLSLIPWEREEARGLASVLKGRRVWEVNIFIGPEGGFEEDEVAYARGRGILPVSLGRRILRAETAGLVTAAAVLYEVGELG